MASARAPARRAAGAAWSPASGTCAGGGWLLPVLSSFALSTLATALTTATLPRFLGGLGLGSGAHGFAIGALALGFVVGEGAVGLVASRLGARWFGWTIAATAPLFVALAFASNGLAALAALVAIGCAQGLSEVALPTILQQEADPEYHARLFALTSTAVRTTMLGAVAAAPLVNRLGSPRDAILTSALVLVLAAAAVLSLGASTRVAASPAAAA